VQGHPGAGKTTLGLQFLLAGAARGERVLLFSLSETAREIRDVARSHGWSLDKVTIREQLSEVCSPSAGQTFFRPAEVELGEATEAIFHQIDEYKPHRVVLDSLAELRLLAGDELRYRRQLLALKHFFTDRGCTSLLLDDHSDHGRFQSLAHGVLSLTHETPEFGSERRRIQVTKLRGSPLRGGYHDYAVRTGGVRVFPRVVAAEHRHTQRLELLPSGVESLDQFIGGGLVLGGTTLLLGPGGTGKSTVALRYALAAAEAGKKAALYLFDETISSMRARARGLGLAVDPHLESGRLTIHSIDPSESTPGEFSRRVQAAVDDGAEMVIIDSISGYLHAMSAERAIVLVLHEVLSYLGQKGVASVLLASHAADFDLSYLADTVLLFQHVEEDGELRKAMSVFKRRVGDHAHNLRRLEMGGPEGVRLGDEVSGSARQWQHAPRPRTPSRDE
jgi:circadian clock protein KaiC